MLHDDASPTTLAFARIWIFGMCLGDVVREPTEQLAGMPLEYLTRIGTLALLPDVWFAGAYTPEFLAGLKTVLLGLLALCVIGLHPFRPIAIVACLALTLHHSLVRSVGHINHGELPMLYGAFVLAVFPSADALTPWRRPGARDTLPRRSPAMYAAPMALIALVFLLSYSFVGAYRLAHGGPAMFVDGSGMRLVLEAAARPGTFGSQSAALDTLATPLGRTLLAVGFPYLTFMEILSPVALFSRRFRLLWLVTMISFHLIAWQLMQILFFHNLMLMPLLATDAESWIVPLTRAFRGTRTACPR